MYVWVIHFKCFYIWRFNPGREHPCMHSLMHAIIQTPIYPHTHQLMHQCTNAHTRSLTHLFMYTSMHAIAWLGRSNPSRREHARNNARNNARLPLVCGCHLHENATYMRMLLICEYTYIMMHLHNDALTCECNYMRMSPICTCPYKQSPGWAAPPPDTTYMWID